MEIMKKKPNVWIHEMMTNNKSAVDSTVVKLKAKEIDSHTLVPIVVGRRDLT